MAPLPAWAVNAAADGTPEITSYRTPGGVTITRNTRRLDDCEAALRAVATGLNDRPGVLVRCTVDQPGRYTSSARAALDLALVFEARGRAFRILALHDQSGALLRLIGRVLRSDSTVARVIDLPGNTGIYGVVTRAATGFSEEDRTKQPSAFGVLRSLTAALAAEDEAILGWYGAFGYDLMIGYDPIQRVHRRPAGYRDLVSFLPRTVLAIDDQRGCAVEVRYEFSDDLGTADCAVSDALDHEVVPRPAPDPDPDHYRSGVRAALRAFHAGDAFETVLSQTLTAPRHGVTASEVYHRLSRRNPSPYGFLINLGRGETLVGASPEMFVRVLGDVVETCPISGTIARGRSAIEDSRNIVELLSSEKEAAELTMCTDVDRNDKSRVAVAGSVRIVSRRQIEMYSRLIHTVDHVTGTLSPDYDAWDAFLSHMWAATVTGAPKRSAAEFIERWETSPRRWYGGAVGYVALDGSMDTGLTLRTARLTGDIAEVRAGATLLIGSDPAAEEAETRLKASAVLNAISNDEDSPAPAPPATSDAHAPLEVLLVDHEDSFVHTLAGYLRESGCRVRTQRWATLTEIDPATDLVVLSPGPGRPVDFAVDQTINAALSAGAAVFGVCLGLQGIVEFFGGRLQVMPRPVHGRASAISVCQDHSELFAGLPGTFLAGRYHSLCAVAEEVPAGLKVTAVADGDVIMAVEHRELPVYAVQFHPESLLSLDDAAGHRIIGNVVALAQRRRPVLVPEEGVLL